MTTWTTEAKQILKIASSGLTGLEMIGEIIKPLLTGKFADLDASVLAALRTIHAIVTTVEKGATGVVTIEAVEDSMTHLSSQLAVNDRQAQADIDKKFPPE